MDWVSLLSTRFPEELTTHLKLFKQSQVRLKHINLLTNKEVSNGNSKFSPKKSDDKKLSHRRNKSDTDLGWSVGMYYKRKSNGLLSFDKFGFFHVRQKYANSA